MRSRARRAGPQSISIASQNGAEGGGRDVAGGNGRLLVYISTEKKKRCASRGVRELRVAQELLSLQFYSYSALLPGLLRCLCQLLLPFWAFTAFVALLPGLLRCLCRLLLPFWAFTAFVALLPGLLRCLCRLLLPFWAFTALVALLPGLLRCLCRPLLPFWAFTAFVDFY